MKQVIYFLLVTISMIVRPMSIDTHAQSALARELVTNPLAVRNRSDEVRSRLEQRINERAIDQGSVSPALVELIEELEHECPLVLVGECEGTCVLNRARNPHFREAFERRVSGHLLKKLASGKSVQYTDFGSGSLFQVLVTVAKVLDKQPAAALDLHVIDHANDAFSFYRDHVGRDRRFTAQDQRMIKEQLSPELISRIKYRRYQEDLEDVEVEKIFKAHYSGIALKSSEMITFLDKAFPAATLSLSLHGCVQDYLSYLTNRQLPYPDVVTAADIQDSYSNRSGAYNDYVNLCIKTLLKNPSAETVWLRIDAQPNSASIATIKSEQESSDNLSGMIFYQKSESIDTQAH